MMRRLGAAVAAVTVSATLAVTVAVIGASPAAAEGGVGTGTGTSGGWTPPPPPPPSDGGGGSGGGGSSGPASSQGDATMLVSGVTWQRPLRSLGTPSRAGRFTGCGRDRQGQTALGATWTFLISNRHADDSGDWDAQTSVITGSLAWSCLYPPAYRETVATCPVSLHATIKRTANPLRALNGEVAARERTTTFGQSLALRDCSGDFTLRIDTALSAWGRYQADAYSRVRSGTVRVFLGPDPRTGRVPEPRLVTRWSAPYTVSPSRARAQSSCLGAVDGWPQTTPAGRGFTFTSSDCPASSTSPVMCRADGAPALTYAPADGAAPVRLRTRALDVMDDGRAWAVTWPTPRATKPSTIHTASTTLQRLGGTPWAEGRALNSQPFVADLNAARTGFVPGPWEMAWQAASHPDLPTRVRLSYSRDGDWRTTVGVIKSVDTATGKVRLGTQPGTLRAIQRCYSDPLAVTALRARNTN